MILIEHTKLFYFYAWLVPDSSMKNVIFKYFFSNLLSNTYITPMLFEEFYEIIGLAGYFSNLSRLLFRSKTKKMCIK